MHYKRRAVAQLLATACGFALLISPSTAAPPDVIPTQGNPFAATLVGAADSKLDLVRTDSGTQLTLDLKECVRYGNFVEPRVGPLWLFADKSVLVANLAGLEKDNLYAESKLFGKLAVPVSSLTGVVLRVPGDRALRDALLASMYRQREADQVVLDNGDKLSGLIESITPPTMSIAADSGNVDLDLSRVAAIAFSSATIERQQEAETGALLGFLDGSRLKTSSLSVENGELRFPFLKKPLEAKISALVAIQSLTDTIEYLSDLEPSSFRHVPYLSLDWPLTKDTNVLGQPLRADSTLHLKGLGMHTASRVTYRVPEGFREFQAELAIDDSAGGKGSATASVFVDDGTGKWQPRYTSPIFRGGEAPLSVRIDLKNVKALSLLTDFADHGDELDHVDWLGARFVK